MFTKSQALTRVLAVAGYSAVSADDAEHPLVIDATRFIEDGVRKLHRNRYWFNDVKMTFVPDALTRSITVPETALNVRPVCYTTPLSLVGQRLFDVAKQSYEFDASLEAWVRLDVQFDELPEVARIFVVESARLEFYTDKGGQQQMQKLMRDVAVATGYLAAEQLRQEPVNWYAGGAYNAGIYRTTGHIV